ncbi:MAG: DUF177 domain-containing protein [Candidatus Limnocylindrales bacterium]
MTARDPQAPYPVDTNGDPLTFAMSGLMAEPPGTQREYEIRDVAVDPGEGLVATSPINGRMRLTRTNRGLIVDARITTTLAGECARCLRPVLTAIDARIDEEVLPTIDLASGQAVALEEGGDPEAPRLTDHHELELRPLVAEAISLQEPIAPLCEPDCPGLCPECGERMEPGHAHGEAPIDPRLEALRAFRVDADAETG